MLPNPHPTASMIQSYLPQGPVLLLVDGNAEGLLGLPPEAQDRVLVVELIDAEEAQETGQLDSDYLRVPYGLPEGDNAVASIPWDAVFSISGRGDGGEITTHSRLDLVPDCLGEDVQLAMRWLMQYLGLGEPPAHPSEWRIGVTPEMMLDDGPRDGFEPDPKQALRHCFEASPPAAVLLVDAKHPGLALPEAWPRIEEGVAQLMVTPLPPLLDVRVDDKGIFWRAPLQNDGRKLGIHAFFVPWSAIGGVQHPVMEMGWFWPLRLPEVMRAPMVANEELAPHLERLAGAPLAPRPPLPEVPPPVLLLAPPNDLPKTEALKDCSERGGGVLLLDARALGVQLSEGLQGAGLLAIPFGVAEMPSTIDFDGGGLDAQMPGFLGEPAIVNAPWSAVFAIATNQGAMRVHSWPEDYPDEVTMALSVMRYMAENGGEVDVSMEGLPIVLGEEAPAPDNRGTTVGLGIDESGHYVLQLRQQCGVPQEDGNTPEMQVAFSLRMKPMH